MNRLLLPLLLLTAMFSLAPVHGAEDDELLHPDEAFKLVQAVPDGDGVRVEWRIADGYYMYRDKIRFETATPGVRLGEAQLPPGKIKEDEFFGKVATYRGTVTATIPVQRDDPAVRTLELTAHSQGCADAGVCYPPHKQTVRVALPAQAAKTDPVAGLSDLNRSLGLSQDQEFLEPDQAFAFNAEAAGPDAVVARWDIADGYYMYRDKFQFKLKDAEGVTLGQVDLPPGKVKDDEFFGRIQVYYDQLEARLPLSRSAAQATAATLEATYQGCAEAGICYPPITKTVALQLPAAGTAATAAPAAPAGPAPAAAPPAGGGQEFVAEQDALAAFLLEKPLWASLGVFFLAGLGLAFTPCVFPMIPILSSIIAGQGSTVTTRRAFNMSLAYVLAMAATYTAAGVVAGLLGANLQAAFQNPWIVSAFAAVFVLLSLSMFGFYDLQMPSALQSRLTELSNRQQGGTLVGVAIMGFLSALIVGPCVAAPLIGALIVIGQTGDAVLGGSALFALSLGMGAPLLAIGTSAGKLLPKAGPWMSAIKAVFGVLLLAVAIWLLERIVPTTVTMLLWALLLIISAVYMGALDRLGEVVSGWRRLWKGVGVVMLIYGALLLVGVAAGGRDYLQPLHGMWATAPGAGSAGSVAAAEHLQFKRIKTVDDLQREVAAAAAQNRPVMLDFYADWCVSCKEFEKYTFSDPGVQQALANAVLLQADVTRNDEHDKALLQHFKLLGPPTILFYGPDGQERRNYRVVGFLDAEAFKERVEKAFSG